MYCLIYGENSDYCDPVDSISVKHYHHQSNARAAMMEFAQSSIDAHRSIPQDDEHYVEITEDSVYIKDGGDSYAWRVDPVEFQDQDESDACYHIVSGHTVKLNGKTLHHKTIRLTGWFHDKIQGYLDGSVQMDRTHNDGITVVFPDQTQVDVQCVRSNVLKENESGDQSWTVKPYIQAVMLDRAGNELSGSECRDQITGSWELIYKNQVYRVEILPPTAGQPDDFTELCRTTDLSSENPITISIVRLDRDFYDRVDRYLTGQVRQGAGDSAGITVKFGDGLDFDVSCKPGDRDGDTSWTEAGLYNGQGGCEDLSDPDGTFTGTWELEDDSTGHIYKLIVLGPDDPVPSDLGDIAHGD